MGKGFIKNKDYDSFSIYLGSALNSMPTYIASAQNIFLVNKDA